MLAVLEDSSSWSENDNDRWVRWERAFSTRTCCEREGSTSTLFAHNTFSSHLGGEVSGMVHWWKWKKASRSEVMSWWENPNLSFITQQCRKECWLQRSKLCFYLHSFITYNLARLMFLHSLGFMCLDHSSTKSLIAATIVYKFSQPNTDYR